MPFFGVDDVLFLLASTTALLWAKRADVVECGVYTTVNLITNDPKDAQRRATAAAEARGSSPSLLLPGFNLDEEDQRYRSLPDDTPRLSDSVHHHDDAGFQEDREMPDLGVDYFSGPSIRPLLVKESVHAQFREKLLVYEPPQVPHRNYNRHVRKPHVSCLVTATEEEVRDCIGKYSVPEVQTLFSKMEREGLWESIIHVSYGIEKAKDELRYLNLHNIECALRTLLNTAHPDAALVYYFRFGEDVLPSDDILAALFHGCRHDEQLSLELCHTLRPFQSQWTPAVYACCLTTTARLDYAQALELYECYMRAQRAEQQSAQRTLRRVLASSALLRETGIATAQSPSRLFYLYHVIIPLVVANDAAKADAYVMDMLKNDPESAPDVFLRCLGSPNGRELVLRYIAELPIPPTGSGGGEEQEFRCFIKELGTTAQRIRLDSSAHLGELALLLYRLNPTAMNMNTLLRLLAEHTRRTPGVSNRTGKLRTSSEVKEASLTAAPVVPSPPTQLPLSMAALSSGNSAVIAKLLRRVPLQTELDASVLARTITESHASWGLAAQFLAAMLRRRCFNVVPSLATHLARHGRWADAAKSMAIYLSSQRSIMTTAEATLCVEASVHAGQWVSALFWVERAHGNGLAMAPTTYDAVLGASRHVHYDVGAACSERGVVDFIETAARQGKVADAFRVLQHHSNVEWTP